MTMTLSRVTLVCALLMLQLACAEHLPNFESGGGTETLHYLISCDPQQDSNCKDLTLDQVANDLTELAPFHMDVNIDINTSYLELTSNASFSGLNLLTISGSADLNTTMVCSIWDYGELEFINISRLILRNLTITNCGSKPHSSTDLEPKELSYISAITILCCKEVEVSHLILRNNNGIGLKILNHQSGMVRIESSKFFKNKLNESRLNDTKGGGGIYVGGFEQHPSEPIIFRFDNCTFRENVAHTECYDYLYTDDLGKPVSGYGIGGGAAILLEKSSTDIHVTFSGCKFIRNVAFKGGGLAAEIEAAAVKDLETRNISITVENSLFEGNGCGFSGSNTTASGGGISINFASKERPTFHSNKYAIHNVTFKGNCAWFGGGLYFYSDNEVIMEQSNTVQIEKCTFEGNRAHTGSAIDITPNVFQRLSLIRGTLTTPVFKDCTFQKNSVTLNSREERLPNQTTYGIGTVYISLYNVKFEGCNRFEYNIGTAIHIVSGNIDMSQSSIHFLNNSGIQGGAIALIGQSSMIVGPNRNYEFINNTAYGKGGGLYVQLDDNHDITASKSCFIQYFDADKNTTVTPAGDWTARITFEGNRAKAGTGHTIFATSLYPCQSINTGTLDQPKFRSIGPSEVFKMRGIKIELEDAQVATEGARLQPENPLLKVIPGERFLHRVNITDDLSNKSSVTLIASIVNNTDHVQIDKAFSSCIGEQMALKGEPNNHASLRLQTTTSRQSYIKLKVELINCPPGFLFNNEKSECVCSHDKYDGLAKCNTTEFKSYIVPGYWAGKVADEKNKSREELVTSYCPLNFCHYDYKNASGSEIQLPRTYDELNKAICGETREGISCSSCASGYTTHFHSPNFECEKVNKTPCELGWLFYILSELVPVTVVFITLLIFNINFASGAANGFILFSQILTSLNVDASGFITPGSTITYLIKIHQFIYGLFNLDFFHTESLSFCLWPNASALDMLAFKYVTIIYVLVLVILVIWFMNKCHSGGKYLAKFCRFTTIKTSVIHGISAFFILCYSQCLNISLKLLRSYCLTVKEGSNLTIYRRVWLNGNIFYFGGKHLPYALPALFCLLTIGIFPLILLLVCPLLSKILSWFGYEESKLVTFIYQRLPYNTLKPLIDSLQSCFSDNLRFFAGLYFLYRWLPHILIARYHAFYTTVEAGIIVILTLHALCQPYTKKVHNIIDTLLFADLALINAITLAHYYVFRTALSRQKAKQYINKTMAVQLVLIYLPLVVMMGYGLLLVYRRFGCGKKYLSKRFVSVYILPSENSTTTISGDNESDLPHRLIADDVDYKCFEDSDRTEHVETDSYSIDVTY